MHRTFARRRTAGIAKWGSAIALSLVAAPAIGTLQAAATASTAATTLSWSIEKSPNPTLQQGSFAAVSCSSSSACIAVGSYATGPSSQSALGAGWNGTAWKLQTVPSPVGALDTHLYAVSCLAADACTAVGSWYNSADTQVPLAEAWNGSAWTVKTTPSPAGPQGAFLTAVSCTSANWCAAVGYSVGGSATGTLAEVWNGAVWTIEPSANPAATNSLVLSGVSCVSTTECTAVGGYTDNGAALTLVEVWDGTTWAIQPSSTPGQGADLYAVSCAAADACVGVGYYIENGDWSFAEVWNGATWTTTPTSNPSDEAYSTLSGVSCASATDCTAVGYFSNASTGADETLAEGWNGTAWTVESTANPTGSSSDALAGVSCAQGSVACMAAGSEYHSPDPGTLLAESWNGSTWVADQTPNPAGAEASYLEAASCPAPKSCVAVGWHDNGAGREVALAESWDGVEWTIETTPDPAGTQYVQFLGVSCVSTTACTAVGDLSSPGTDGPGPSTPIAEVWNGEKWALEKIPSPAGAQSVSLSGVSCVAATSCTVVGSWTDSSETGAMLAEAWNGKSWKIETVSSPSGVLGSSLSGVSCVSSRFCTAIGSYRDSSSSGPLAAAWRGSSWTVTSLAIPSGRDGGQLSGVSCVSATFCTAVGTTYEVGSASETLAEGWNGTAWRAEGVPTPAGITDVSLPSVSCTSTSACTAMGYSRTEPDSYAPLAETLSGSMWTIDRTPVPAGGGLFFGGSCVAGGGCTAVGDSGGVTLVERD
jgi:hypothetical protein